ncbi:hypothetical protein FXO38_27336 [Capsicum annuum]|nr:hypothetical protein FXO38_27336 [Capsicum annuum]
MDPYSGYSPLQSECLHNTAYEELPEVEQICSERHTNIFSSFGGEASGSLGGQSYQVSGAGGRWKIGNDASQFIGPLILNQLLQVLGVLLEAQYFQNVTRVGNRLRSTLQTCLTLHTIWSAPLSITVALILLYQQLGVAALLGALMLVLMFPVQDCLLEEEHFRATRRKGLVSVIKANGFTPKFFGARAYANRIILNVFLFNLRVSHLPQKTSLMQSLTVRWRRFTYEYLMLRTFVIRKMCKLTEEGLQRTDKRIGFMNEVLAAMDTVKSYAWEKSFQSKVQGVRNEELTWFRKSQLLGALNSFILNSIPVVVIVISFGIFSLLGGDLTPAKAFTSLSLFAVLRFPLFMLPITITQVVNANVSLKRLEELLLAEERILLPNPPLEPGLPAISIKNGCFSWESKVYLFSDTVTFNFNVLSPHEIPNILQYEGPLDYTDNFHLIDFSKF